MRLAIAALAVVSCLSVAEQAIQTDWSDGLGLTGPVTDLGSCFCVDTDVSWYYTGSVLLVPCENQVSGYYRAQCLYPVDMDLDGDVDVTSMGTDCSVRWWKNPGSDASRSEKACWTAHNVSVRRLSQRDRRYGGRHRR